MIASLNTTGRMAVVCPHGVLFRSGAEGTIRKGMLEADLIEAVVGLGPNLFYGTGIPAAVLFINKNKSADRKLKVLIVNGSEEFAEGKNQNSLSNENVQRLSAVTHLWQEEERFSQVVSLDEIRENDFNLNITRYVDVSEPVQPIDVAQELLRLKELLGKRDESEATMLAFLEELGYGSQVSVS